MSFKNSKNFRAPSNSNMSNEEDLDKQIKEQQLEALKRRNHEIRTIQTLVKKKKKKSNHILTFVEKIQHLNN